MTTTVLLVFTAVLAVATSFPTPEEWEAAIGGEAASFSGGLGGATYGSADANAAAEANSVLITKPVVPFVKPAVVEMPVPVVKPVVVETVVPDTKHVAATGTGNAGGGFFAVASLGTGGTKTSGGTTIFDDIFNIPTSVLRSVNQLLNNNRKQVVATVSAGTASQKTDVVATNDSPVIKQPSVVLPVYKHPGCTPPHCGKRVAAAANAEASSGASEGSSIDGVSQAGVNGVIVAQKSPTLYNDILNIPISTLSAVNKFLNNLG